MRWLAWYQMLPRLSLGLFFIFFSLSSGVTHAQDNPNNPWSTWLYDQESETLIRVNLDGTLLDEVNIPELTGYHSLQPTFAFSPDGNILAACIINDDETNAILLVYDTLNDTVLQTRDLGDVVYCTLFRGSFSFDGQYLAYGAIFDFYDGPVDVLWLFEVMDITSGAMLHSLSPDNPAFAEIDYSSLPASVYFDTTIDMIVISMQGYAIDGGFPTSTFVWRYGENELTPQEGKLYGKIGFNILPARGEIIWLDRNDDDYTPSEMIGPTPNLNVAMSSDKSGNHKVLASFGPAQGLFLTYIENGQRVLMRIIGYDAEIDELRSEWLILSRLGEQVVIPDFMPLSVIGTKTGFMALQPLNSGVALMHYEFENNMLSEGEMVWQTIVENTNTWSIVWSSSLQGDGAYPAWVAQ